MRAARLGIALLGATLCTLASTAFANPDTTHRLKLKLAGGIEVLPGFVAKGSANDKDIVNLAQGRSVEFKVPKNEILAITIDCATGDAQVVVWNTTTDMQIVAVSTVFSTTDDIAIHEKNGVEVWAFSIASFDFNPLGNATWGITGGTLDVAATVKFGDESGSVCPSTVKAFVLGKLGIVVDGDSFEILVIKGKLAAGKPGHIAP